MIRSNLTLLHIFAKWGWWKTTTTNFRPTLVENSDLLLLVDACWGCFNTGFPKGNPGGAPWCCGVESSRKPCLPLLFLRIPWDSSLRFSTRKNHFPIWGYLRVPLQFCTPYVFFLYSQLYVLWQVWLTNAKIRDFFPALKFRVQKLEPPLIPSKPPLTTNGGMRIGLRCIRC